MNNKISSIKAYEVLDSRGVPTVLLKMYESGGIKVEVTIPSGASTGIHEALELRDGDSRYGGLGVRKVVDTINDYIAPKIIGLEPFNPTIIEDVLSNLDNSKDKSVLGANAILPISLAAYKMSALLRGLEVFELFDSERKCIPIPMLNVINGGLHANNNLDIQEFMIVPHGFKTFSEALEASVKVYKTLGKILRGRGLETGLGDEGGYSPKLDNDEMAFDILIEAINQAGYDCPSQFVLAIDVASSGFVRDDGLYHFPKRGIVKSRDEMIEYYRHLCSTYPLWSIEDGLAEDDFEGFNKLHLALPQVNIVGDDLFVTNNDRLNIGIQKDSANSILIKYNQVGTIKETLETIINAVANDYRVIVSHRSGDTSETIMSDLAVGTGSLFIKAGAPSRYERVSKYNRLLEIESDYKLPYASTIYHL